MSHPGFRAAEARVERALEHEPRLTERGEQRPHLVQELGLERRVGVGQKEGELRAGVHHGLPGACVVGRLHVFGDGEQGATGLGSSALLTARHGVPCPLKFTVHLPSNG